MKKVLLLAFSLGVLASCAGVTDEELNKRLTKIEERLNAIEERQRSLEAQNIKTETRLDSAIETLTKLRLEVERLKGSERESKEKLSLSTLPQISQEKSQQKLDYQKEYEDILRLYDLRQLNQAKEGFINYIKKYPNTPFTDNAYLWLGVTYRDLGELGKAEAVWLTLVEKCRRKELIDCNKAPSALLQLARLYEQKGDQLKANEYYDLILKEYPLSEEADIAKKKLGK